MILVAYNPSTDNLEKSYLTSSYSVGVTSLLVRNSDNFSANDRILIGQLGNENSEVVTVSAVNSDKVTLTVGATKFPHSASDPVYVLRYDQIKFYRSTTTVDGDYTELATVNIDVDNDEGKTLYDDTGGLTSYFYKISFYHSLDAVESELSDPIPGEGYGKKQVGTLINEFLVEVGDTAQEYITVPQSMGLINECNEDIIGQSRKPYRFLRTYADVDIDVDNDRISLTSAAFDPELIKFDRAKYTNSLTTADETVGLIPMVSIEEMEYYKYSQTTLPNPLGVGIQVGAIDETTNELVLYPTPTTAQTAAIRIYYWGDFNYITSLADTIQTPVKRIYKMFMLGRYYRMRAKKESSFLNLADRYTNDYNTEVVKLQRAQRVDVGTPMSFQPDTRTRQGLRRRG
jgi:hypothetical protein